MATSHAWQDTCGLQRLVAHGSNSSVVCLAMVAGLPIPEAQQMFVHIGLGIRRSGRPAFSVNSSEMRMAVSQTGLMQQAKRWRGWNEFSGLGIIKMRADWLGGSGQWYWTVAFRHPVFDVAIFDPYAELPSFKQMPLDVLCIGFDTYEPRGEWIQVEQRFDLAK
ncbi:hypothetical protein JW321_05950 [Pseudomonas syringae pv. papulans]|nr:hypothetical protein [Pseudomonas syringae pv. papulans]